MALEILRVVPHDAFWRIAFETESELIADAMRDNLVAIHHIGSTSIPNIYAKPVIDILVEVADIEAVELHNARMESLGYQVMGEFGIPGRRYFRKDDEHEVRTHQIHVFTRGFSEAERHLAFRDYMIAHPEDAQAYSELKRKLAAEFANCPNGYMDGKDGFIKEIDRKAAAWRRASKT